MGKREFVVGYWGDPRTAYGLPCDGGEFSSLEKLTAADAIGARESLRGRIYRVVPVSLAEVEAQAARERVKKGP